MVSIKSVLTVLSITLIHHLLFSCPNHQLLAAEERIFNLSLHMRYICMIIETQRKLLIPSPFQCSRILLSLSSPGRWHGTCRCERTTLTCGLTLSRRATAQTRASTCPSLKRPAVATWSKWEAKSKPGRNAGLCSTATDARSPTTQVGQKQNCRIKLQMRVHKHTDCRKCVYRTSTQIALIDLYL